MLRCKEVVKIASSFPEALSWRKKIELRLHLMMCRHCSRYVTQLEIISDEFRTLVLKKTSADPAEVRRIESEVLKNLPK